MCRFVGLLHQRVVDSFVVQIDLPGLSRSHSPYQTCNLLLLFSFFFTHHTPWDTLGHFIFQLQNPVSLHTRQYFTSGAVARRFTCVVFNVVPCRPSSRFGHTLHGPSILAVVKAVRPHFQLWISRVDIGSGTRPIATPPLSDWLCPSANSTIPRE